MSTLPRVILVTLLGLATTFGTSNAAPVNFNNHEAWKAGKTINTAAIEKPAANAPVAYPVSMMFAAAPVIASFSPLAGPVGTLVTINGANLLAPTAITIGGSSAVVVSNTGSILVAMVMPGAATGKVSITTSGGAVSSSGSFTITATKFPVAQQGPSLVGSGGIGNSNFGRSVALSSDGKTIISGAPFNNGQIGATWAFVRNGGVWSQQAEFAGTDNIGAAEQGWSVALSADGNTALVGGINDNSGVGAVWVYIRSGSTWIQQGPKLVGTGGVGASQQGASVALSADGNTAIFGGDGDNGDAGAVWVFTRSGSTWTQQGAKLVASDGAGTPLLGYSAAMSADGNTAIVGGNDDYYGTGAAWVYARSGGVWTQQGPKLVGSDINSADQGFSVAISSDGNTVIAGSPGSGGWVYVRSGGAWTQQGLELTSPLPQGKSVSLSADGNTAMIGGPADNQQTGALWIYTRSGGNWAQQGSMLTGTANPGDAMGQSGALSADGTTAVAAGVNTKLGAGQAWVFTASSDPSLASIALTPSSTLTNTGTTGATTSYTTSVSNATASVTVTPVTNDPTATVIVNNMAVTSGTASAPIALAEGAGTTITTVVTAGDGTTTHTYSIVVTRAPSTNAFLSNIKTSPASTLTNTGTTASTTTYTGTIGNDITSVTLTPTAADPNAAITVNGIAVASGAASGAITLPGGQGAATTITIAVTAQDGTTTHTYLVTLTHEISTDALLSTLKITPATPLTNNSTTGSTTTYTASVTSTNTSVTVTPATEDPSSTVTVNGIAVTSGAASAPIAIAATGQTNITIVVTAQNETTTHTYLIAVTPGTAILNSIAVTPSSGLVNTGTSGSTTSYTTTVSSTTAAITVTPVAQDPTATIKVNGIAVASGSASGPIAIAFGQTIINTVVTAEDGTTTHTYSIIVSRLSNNAALSIIKLDPASALINTGTSGNTTTYTTSVGYTVSTVSIITTTEDPNATVTVNGIGVAPGTPSGSIILPEAATTTITIVVTAQDGITVRNYSIAVSRAGSSDATLSIALINLNGLTFGLDPTITGTTESVTNAENSLPVTPTSEDPNAAITVNGIAVVSGATVNIPLVAGLNTLTIVVTATDGSTTTTYTTTIDRESNDALLSTIKLTPAAALTNTGTSGNTTTYTVTVNDATTTVTPTTQDPNATVTVNGAAVASGTASGSIALAFGNNTITTTVTSQDGTATRNYVINITRVSNDALVSSIKLTPSATLTDAGTIGNTTLYTTTIGNTVPSVTVTPITQDPTSAITVNGVAVISGTASGVIALPGGQGAATTITIVVTSSDGTTIHTYLVTVTHAISVDALLTGIKLSPYSALTNTGTSGSTTTYTTTVSNATTSATVTPTTEDPTATVTVNGVAVVSGTASGSIALAIGDNTITTIVTAQDGITTRTYLITVHRISNNARLSIIALTPASILTNTGTTGNTTTYTATVNYTTTSSVTLTPTSADPNATITVNGVIVASGTASGPIALTVVAATPILIGVTAEDGTTISNYVVIVTEAPPSSNALLSIIKLTPAIALTNTGTSGNTTTYTATVGSSTTSVTVTPTAQDATATIEVNGATVTSGIASGDIALAVGPNTITTVVTSQDGSATHSYSIVITRLSNDAMLSIIKLTPDSALTNTGTSGSTTTYTTTVSDAETSVTVTPTTHDPNAMVTVNGVAVASGTASQNISLAAGTNIITTIVAAQDPSVTRNYVITVISEGPPAISSFSPASGPIGTLVTVNGTNLNTPSVFTIGGQSAIVVSNTGSTLVAMVMPGATTGTVSITTPEGSASSSGGFTVTAAKIPTAQQGPVLFGTGNTVGAQQGTVAVSADGNTAIVGGAGDNGGVGAAWIYTRTGNAWSLQGSKLIGTGSTGVANQGQSVGLSADGNTAIVGGSNDNSGLGAAWVFTRSGGVWTQQGSKLVGTDAIGSSAQGFAVSLSADGNTAIVGGVFDNSSLGALWVFTRGSGTWSQQGPKLVGTGGVGWQQQGCAVSLSADGGTAIVGADGDNGDLGAAWMFTRSGSMWTQQGAKLVGTGTVGASNIGQSVSLSADGNTAIVGGVDDNANVGAAWVFTRSSGAWTQQGSKLVGTDGVGTSGQGCSVSLSADGNTAVVSGPQDNNQAGAIWVYTRNGVAWAQHGSKLVGTGTGAAYQGTSVAISANGSAALAGGVVNNSNGQTGAVWVFTASSNAVLSTIALTPASTLSNTGTSGSTTTYTTTVSNATPSVTVTPTSVDPGATIKVNGVAVTSGTASGTIALAEGAITTINTIVTAADGTTTRTYLVAVTRQPSNNALLSTIKLTPASALTNTGTAGSITTYTTTASGAAASVTVTPVTQDPDATVTVNGVVVPSGTASGSIALAIGSNTVNTVVTAADGTTTHTYTINISRLSNNALLSVIKLTPAAALTNTGTSGSTTTYTTTVGNATTSVTVTPTMEDPTATATVNGVAVVSGTASGSIALIVGSNTITTIVTAQDGTTTRTYSITVTRATGPLMSLRLPVSVVQPTDALAIENNDNVMVHQGVSPNGDGINDFLTIDGLAAYPDNNLMIIDRSGVIIFEAAGYDNVNKVFDGHSNINGRMQQPGTYFYALDYVVNGQNRHKTGFIVLKY